MNLQTISKLMRAWTVRVAHNLEEDKELIEVGFEYVTERDGFKIYRKRK